MPISGLSPGEPIAPTAASSFPMTATTTSAPATSRTRAFANELTSTLMPIARKKTGMNRCPTGVRSRSIRSRSSLRLSERPATNAPTIGASFAAFASSAKNSVKASARATSVPADREWCCTQRNSGGPNRPPTRAVTTRNPTATPTMPSTVAIETVPSVTIRTTTVRMTSPSTSSATAAPNTVRASTDVSARRSLNTRAVMPTLVAANAAPRKSAVFES